jgi:hypothetical protein
MAVKTKNQTVTAAARVMVSPSTGVGSGAWVALRSVSGVARLYGSETDSEFLTFSDSDPLAGQMFLEPGDEMWVLADSADVVIESILVGVAE